MNVIGHQNPGPTGYTCCPQAFSKEIAIERVVSIFKEGALTTIAALRDMMRQAWYDETSETGHSFAGNTDHQIRSNTRITKKHYCRNAAAFELNALSPKSI